MRIGRHDQSQQGVSGSLRFSCQLAFPPGPSYCNYCIVGLPVCTMTSQNGVDGNILSLVFTRISPNEIKVDVTLVGKNPCVSFLGAPAIDAVFTVRLRQLCVNGQLMPMEYKIDSGAAHDGFPWHELYINDVHIYRYDPCIERTDPFALGGGLDVSIEAQDPLLTTWRPVPFP